MKSFKVFMGLCMALMFTMCVVSCNKKANVKPTTTDSTKVDSAAVDSVDSVKADSAVLAPKAK